MIKRILCMSLFFQCLVICDANNTEIDQVIPQETISDKHSINFDNPTREQIDYLVRGYVFVCDLSGQSDIASIVSRLKKIDYKHNILILSLAYCDLESLPDELGDFVNLLYLDLRGNRLKELPNWISKLSNLKYLDLADNQLTGLPDTLEELVGLEIINVSNNQFSEFPLVLGRLNVIPIANNYPEQYLVNKPSANLTPNIV